MKALSERLECTSLLQRGREKEKFAVIPKADLAGETQESIADAVGMTVDEVKRGCNFAELPNYTKPLQTAALFADDFKSRFSESPAFLSALAANKRNRVRIPV